MNSFAICIYINLFLLLVEIFLLIKDYKQNKNFNNYLSLCITFLIVATIFNITLFKFFNSYQYLIGTFVIFTFHIILLLILSIIWFETIEYPEEKEYIDEDFDDLEDDIIEDSINES
jgi:hypothetical protein